MMTDFVGNITEDTYENLLEEIYDKFDELREIRTRYWNKYGKKRIFFNVYEGKESRAFYIEFDGDHLEIGDYQADYWNTILEVTSKEEFEEEIHSTASEFIESLNE